MIAIIDYGVGNLRSVEKALQYVGGEAFITSDPDEILEAEAVVLPGVGAFAEAMDKIRERGLDEAVRIAIKGGRPFLGICLGMQMLFEFSEEGEGLVPGLGIFKGNIRKFPMEINKKIPHMGWNTLEIEKPTEFLSGVAEGAYFYFVHSYYLESNDRTIVAGTTEYGLKFDSCISNGNVFATQFHPEKSGGPGLGLLKNFINITNRSSR